MRRSSAQWCEMTHPVLVKRTQHPFVKHHCAARGRLRSQGKRGNVFVFIYYCLNPCSFHREAIAQQKNLAPSFVFAY